MKKARIFAMIMILSTFFSVASQALYTDGPSNNFYNRTAAAQYVYDYTKNPNPAYYDYSDPWGDCTNFASQVLRAGGMPMTPSVSNPTTKDWYYYGPNWGSQRTATWTDAQQFRYYWADVNGIGEKKAHAFTRASVDDFKSNWYQIYIYLEPGDIVQYVNPVNGVSTHSQIVHRKSLENGKFKVSMGQHSENLWVSLYDYVISRPADTIICIIKIKAHPTSSSRTYSLNAFTDEQLSEYSISKLQEMDDALFNSTPNTMEGENEKWAKINAINEELISRAQAGEINQKTTVTKDLLLEFINYSIDYNRNLMRSIEYNPGDPSLASEIDELYKRCQEQNEQLEGLLLKVTNIEYARSNGDIGILWNEYWTDIIKCDIPEGYVY